MNKITIVTGADGHLIGAVRGHTLSSKEGMLEAKVSFAKGHKLHRVEIDEEMDKSTDPDAFHARLLKHLPKG